MSTRDRQPETIAVTGRGSTDNADLLRAYFGPRAKGLDPSEIDTAHAAKLQRNKLSPLGSSDPAASFEALSPSVADLAQRLQDRQRRWEELLPKALAIFDEVDTAHVLMKALRSPFALMSDVDFLVPWPGDVARAVEVLEIKGYALYRFRLLAHPLKIMAIPPGQGLGEPPQVDIYPDAMWVRRHVLDGVGIVARRRKLCVRGVEAWVPDPADDVYLVATHALARGDITLAELDHGARVIADEPSFCWSRMVEAAAAFGCQDSLYAYLRVLEIVAERAGHCSLVPSTVLQELQSSPSVRAMKRWLDRAEGDLALPLAFPIWDSTVRAAVHHLPAIRSRVPFRELVMDAAAHGLAVGAHLLKRD